MHYCLPTVFSTSRFATLPLGDRTRFFVDTTTRSYIVIKSARGIPILNTMARICSEVITHFLLNSRIRWKSRHSARSTRALVNFVKDILLFTRPAHRIRLSGGRAALALVSGPIRGIRSRFTSIGNLFPFAIRQVGVFFINYPFITGPVVGVVRAVARAGGFGRGRSSRTADAFFFLAVAQ